MECSGTEAGWGDLTFGPCTFQNVQKQRTGSQRFQSLLGPSSEDLRSQLVGTKITLVESADAGVRLPGFSYPSLITYYLCDFGKVT